MNIKSRTTYMQILCLGLSIDPPPHTHILHVSIDVHFFVYKLLVSDTRTLIIDLHVSISIYVIPVLILSTNVFLTHNLVVPSMKNSPPLALSLKTHMLPL